MKGGSSDSHNTDSQDEVVERVKARLQEEGREARNLVAYSLPLQDPPHAESAIVWHREVRRVAEMIPRRGSKQDKRPRSASAGRDPQASLRARHWGFLFRNLQQAVDEIYQTCEDDESIVECKEAILMLERYSSDFQKLIEWLKLKWEYEHTPPPQRPNSLTWEIRTSSPGKALQHDRKILTVSDARRALTFDTKQGRPGLMNGNVQEEKTVDKLQSSKQDALDSDVRILSGVISPTKPVIVVHEANVDERQKNTQFSISVEKGEVQNERVLEKVNECDGNEASEMNDIENSDENLTQKEENVQNAITKIAENCVENGKLTDVMEGDTITEKESIEKVINNNATVKVVDRKVECEDKTCQEDANNSCKVINCSEAFEDSLKMNSDKDFSTHFKVSDSPKSKETKSVRSNTTIVGLKSKDNSLSLPIKASDTNKIAEGKTCDVKTSESGEVKRSCADVLQGKSPMQKPGPTVNMNKASQVRQAFNQNKTPPKQLRSMSANSRLSSVSRSFDIKTNISKQQGAGGKLTYRRVEGKAAHSPPLTRRQTVDPLRSGSGGGSRHTAPNAITRSYSSLGTMSRGLARGNVNLADSRMGKCYGSSSFSNNGVGNHERTASSSSLSSSTSSSGQSWADKVRGAPLSLQSSRLSLQDDGEGWEVVRRGRRSHGGSTASLNSNNHQGHNSPSVKDTRSGSLKMDGHYGREIKQRFHVPSSAMSMPSLIICESSVSNDVSKATGETNNLCQRRNSQRNCQVSKSQSLPSGKKSISHGSLVSSIDSEGREDKVPDFKKQFPNGSKRTEGRKSRRNPKSVEEIGNKSDFQRENETSFYLSVTEKEKSQNTVNEVKKSTCVDVKITECDMQSKDQNDKDSMENEEMSMQKNYESSISENLHESNGALVSHICDPSIPETSETSDADDDEGKTQASLASESLEIVPEQDLLQAERESRSYDSDSQMDEEEMRKNAAALESAVQEEQRLKRQIEETEKTEIKVEDVDDCEEEGSDVFGAGGRATSPLTPPYDSLLSSLSWADQVDAMESLDELRHPGRVLHIHEKLSSPSRKRSLSEKMRRHEEKLAKAQELRENFIQAKTDKLKDLFKKIEEVRQDKECLLDKKRELFHRKMKRAEEKRKQYLQEIVNKAHDEENKAKEIAFINGLEAQNKLHDIMQQHQSHESRLADMAEERTRRQEEKAAKEVAAQERRKALEAERQARMAELCEKRRRRCERIDRQQAERREELLEQAREKARDREERLSALQQAQQAKESELVKKIQQKQEESARRHEENIEQIRQRALESSIMKYSRGCDDAPRLIRYETKKLCTLCNSLITSEVYLLSHLRGRRHQEALKALHQADVLSTEDSETYNLKHIVDAPANIDDPQVTRDKERHKALRRRCRKIRTRMITRGKEYNSAFKPTSLRDSPNKVRIIKALQQIAKLVANQGSGPWPSADLTALDRPLLELIRIMDKREAADQMLFSAQDGFSKIDSVLKVILESNEQRPCVLPAKSLGYSGRVLLGVCRANTNNCRHTLYSNLVGSLIDYLMQRLNELVIETTRVGSNSSINTIVNLPADTASAAIFEVLAEVVHVLCDGDIQPAISSQDQAIKDQADSTWQRLQDIVSYCVSVGLADKVSWYFSHVQGPLDNDAGVVEVILAAMRLVSALAKTLAIRSLPEDPTQLIGTLHVTDACGVVSLLYGILLHQGGRSSLPQAPPKLSQTTHAITVAATTLLHNLASLDLAMFQGVLGSEGISLEFRHIASYLLWYCSHWPCEDILHNIIPLVGFFAVNNRENQMVIQSGEVPSVLQQLCNLPWQYFSEPNLTAVLFPTLLACCLHNHDNMIILQQEMSFQVLEDFLHNNQASDKPLIHILERTHVQG
nr:S phase cyclin A-associated protein in the endoplasmic reticulum-like isoform X1 [Procambarus clarkii]XP_045611736.1 S phase cyclin A-associated protein in the endoplasmic reticulum-like isoform X1 [Procambarus clarkii]XP_045611737.1 S phase cyclin A-associated protein in the endoplasmic reticulum-like isoform X1 [Procambarus clarkii]